MSELSETSMSDVGREMRERRRPEEVQRELREQKGESEHLRKLDEKGVERKKRELERFRADRVKRIMKARKAYLKGAK